jgi:hypothetical protein
MIAWWTGKLLRWERPDELCMMNDSDITGGGRSSKNASFETILCKILKTTAP